MNIPTHIRPSKSIGSLNKSEERYASYNINKFKRFNKLDLKSKEKDQHPSEKLKLSDEKLQIKKMFLPQYRSSKNSKQMNFLNLKTHDFEESDIKGNFLDNFFYI